jgi:hypothetical protein
MRQIRLPLFFSTNFAKFVVEKQKNVLFFVFSVIKWIYAKVLASANKIANNLANKTANKTN